MKLKKRCNCSRLIAAIEKYIAKANDNLAEGLREAGFVDPKKTVKKINDLEDELAKILRADNKVILNTINDYDDLEDFVDDGWPGIKDSKDVVEKISATFNSRFSDDIPEYTAEYLKRVESDAVLDRIALTHETTAWISSWSDRLGEIMKLTDNTVIEKILSNGLKNGDSIADTAKKISDARIRDPGYRARRVAITETLRAHSVAQQESFMQSPAVEMKLWRHSGWREFARENHMAIDGQTVRKDEPFTLFGADGGVYNPMYPRDIVLPAGESINCGCISEPIVSEYVLGLSLEERNQLRDEAIAEMNETYDSEYMGNPEDGLKGLEIAEPTKHSREEIDEIRQYADESGVSIKYLNRFDGETSVLIDQIDAIREIREEYGIQRSVGIVLEPMTMALGDTHKNGRNITISLYALRSRENTNAYLNSDNVLSSTDAKGIGYHEMGHIISKEKGEQGIEIARKAYYNLHNKEISRDEMLVYLKNNISDYSKTPSQNAMIRSSGVIYDRDFNEILPEVLAKEKTNPSDFTHEFIRLFKEANELL